MTYIQGSLGSRVEDTPDAMPARLRWRLDPAKGGTSHVMGDIGTHAHQLLSFVTGQPVARVMAEVGAVLPGRAAHDTGMALLEMADGAKGVLLASKAATGAENALSIEVYGEAGGLFWEQASLNQLRHMRNGEAARLLTRGLPGLHPLARRAARVPPGHPEGFHEAFANLYADFAEAVAARLAGTTPDPLCLHFPTADDGAAGLAFVEVLPRLDQGRPLGHGARHGLAGDGPGPHRSPALRPLGAGGRRSHGGTDRAPEPRHDHNRQAHPAPTFFIFSRIGLTSFGGGVSGWLLREFVQDRDWMSEEEFLNGLAISQALPGVNVKNMAIWIGYRLLGRWGAVAGFAGIIVPPGIVIVLLGVLFASLARFQLTHVALAGAAAAAIGLSLSMGITAVRRVPRRMVPMLVMAATFVAIGILHWPLVWVVLGAGSVSIAAASLGLAGSTGA